MAEPALFYVIVRASPQIMMANGSGFKPIYVTYDEDRDSVNITSSRDIADPIKDMHGKAGLEAGVSAAAAQVLTISMNMRAERLGDPHAGIASDIVSMLERGVRAGSWYLLILDEYRVADPQRLANFLDIR